MVALFGCPTGDVSSPPTFLSERMVSLPRLKEFSLSRIVKSFAYRTAPMYASTETVYRLLTWLLEGMPNVESFSFRHGETTMTRKDEATFQCPPLPGIVPPNAEILWPSSLKHLQLQTLNLDPLTFSNTEMPSLKTALFKKCGPNVDNILEGLRRTHPNVQASE